MLPWVGLIVVIIIIWISLRLYTALPAGVRSQRFYDVSEVYPALESIPRDDVMSELSAVARDKWSDWPEKNLWDEGPGGATWTVFPLIAFGRRVKKNCAKMPKLMEFINRIDKLYGVKIAILSRLSPGMKLVPHQGWGDHSNNVLRCHYGLVVPAPFRDKGRPRDCRIEVADELTDKCTDAACTDAACTDFPTTTHTAGQTTKCRKCYNGYVYEARIHSEGEWIVFDDSKMHMAENTTQGERIVLIIDVARPEWIPAGTSTVEDTSELKDIITEYEKNYNSSDD